MGKIATSHWVQRVACLRSIVAFDLRSLALFRVTLGILLLTDLARRMQNLSAFYTDSGVYPRSLLAGKTGFWRITLHAANGQMLFELVLFLAALTAGAALLAGWHTRRATFISWILFVSLLNRVPMLVTPGEMLLAALLFWATFLPLNYYWSIDAAVTDLAAMQPDRSHASWASAALLFQMTAMFILVTGVTGTGSPVHGVLERDDYLTFGGLWLQGHPALAQMAGEAVRTIGLIAPVFLFFPTHNLRRLAIIALALIQLCAEIILKQNLLGWTALAAMAPLIDSGFWDLLSRSLIRTSPLRIYHDRNRPRTLRTHRLLRTFLILPTAELLTAQDEPRTNTLFQNNQSWIVIDHDEHAYLQWNALILLFRRSPLLCWLGWALKHLPFASFGNAFYTLISRHGNAGQPWVPRPVQGSRLRSDRFVVPLCLLLMLAWNLGTSGLLPPTVNQILMPPARLLRLDQHWSHALPQPRTVGTGWFVAPGILADHRIVDAIRPGTPLNFSAPAELSSLQGNVDWHRYLDRLRYRRLQGARARYSRFLCHRWNQRAKPSRRLLSLQLVYLTEPTSSKDDSKNIEQEILWRQNCRTDLTDTRRQ